MNQSSSFYRLMKPMVSSSLSLGMKQNGPLMGMLKQYHDIPQSKTEPFSLLRPKARRNLVYDKWRNFQIDAQVLGSGMILFKNYLSLRGQVDIVNICQKAAMGPGGFYQPSNPSGAKLRLRMMCFGKNWDPVTKYEERYRSDGSEPPPLPYELISLADNTIKDARCFLDELPSIRPNICLASFYNIYGRLGLHQDRDESPSSLSRGLPVISVSIGASAEFLYGHTKDENKLDTVLLESGDVLIFGGESRSIFHGVKRILQNSAPSQLLQEAELIPGRLNLNLKQV